MDHTKLGVNIAHVATIRNARGEIYPDPLRAALIAKKSGADSITIHLREDRRHILDFDLIKIKKKLKIPLNLEMAPTKEMLKIALKNKPHYVCIVPEKRKELTTEGGLNLKKNMKFLIYLIKSLKKKDIIVSLFINPEIKDVKLSKDLWSDCVELDTGDLSRGTFNNLFTNLYTEEQLEVEFKDCSEGGISAAGVNATADENFMIADEGEESVCPGFASLPEGDKIIYARLGRLMPERRREEINFRGRGKIRGYQIKMNEHVVSYDTKKTDIDKIIVYDSIVKQIMDTFNEWKNDREKRINHKNMLNTVHSQIIKYFEETM